MITCACTDPDCPRHHSFDSAYARIDHLHKRRFRLQLIYVVVAFTAMVVIATLWS